MNTQPPLQTLRLRGLALVAGLTAAGSIHGRFDSSDTNVSRSDKGCMR
jgi:hypothetical protein